MFLLTSWRAEIQRSMFTLTWLEQLQTRSDPFCSAASHLAMPASMLHVLRAAVTELFLDFQPDFV